MNIKTIFTIVAIVAAVGIAIPITMMVPSQQAHAAAHNIHHESGTSTVKVESSSPNSFDNANANNFNIHITH